MCSRGIGGSGGRHGARDEGASFYGFIVVLGDSRVHSTRCVPRLVPVPAALPEKPPVQEKPVLEEKQKWKKKFTKVVGALKFASGFKAIMGLGFGKKKKKKAEVVEIVEEVEVEVTADAKQRRENKASILT